jgi:adenylate kinase family enzyme
MFETGKVARGCTPEKERKVSSEDRYEYAEEIIRGLLCTRKKMNLVVDGFPRSVEQAEFLVANKIPFWLFFLTINPVLQYGRMEKRGRPDDTMNKVVLRTLAARRLWQDLENYCAIHRITTIVRLTVDEPEKAYQEMRRLLNA